MKEILIMAGAFIGVLAFLGAAFSPALDSYLDKKFSTDKEREETYKKVMHEHQIMLTAHHNDDAIYSLMVDNNSRLREVEINDLRESILQQEAHQRETRFWTNNQQIRLDNTKAKLQQIIRTEVDYESNYKSGLGPKIPHHD